MSSAHAKANGAAATSGSERQGMRWVWREREMRRALQDLTDAAFALATIASCWDRERSESMHRLMDLEEQAVRMRSVADQLVEHAGALLDHAARENEPHALPREDRMQWLTDKLLGEARRNADRR